MIYTIGPSQLYLTFISIVFGVFFAVWIIPLSKYYLDPPNDDLETTLAAIFSRPSFRGAEMFIILVCLWWWYGTFIGNVAPAQGFWAYLFDFVSLCSFAVSFQMWSHRTLFPIVVLFAAFLMLVRFLDAQRYIESGSDASHAVWSAIGILCIFIISAGSALIAATYIYRNAVKEGGTGITFRASLEKMWFWVENGILGLLGVGIAVTFFAVWLTEGVPFATPIKPEVWMRPG